MTTPDMELAAVFAAASAGVNGNQNRQARIAMAAFEAIEMSKPRPDTSESVTPAYFLERARGAAVFVGHIKAHKLEAPKSEGKAGSMRHVVQVVVNGKEERIRTDRTDNQFGKAMVELVEQAKGMRCLIYRAQETMKDNPNLKPNVIAYIKILGTSTDEDLTITEPYVAP